MAQGWSHQAAKSNKLGVPSEQDQNIIGKAMTREEYPEVDNFGFKVFFGVDNLDDNDQKEYEAVWDVHYPWQCEEMENNVSLAMHVNPSHGRKIVKS